MLKYHTLLESTKILNLLFAIFYSEAFIACLSRMGLIYFQNKP